MQKIKTIYDPPASELTQLFYSLRFFGLKTNARTGSVRFHIGRNLLGIGLTLIVGMCFRQVREAILLWWLLFPLRKMQVDIMRKLKQSI